MQIHTPATPLTSRLRDRLATVQFRQRYRRRRHLEGPQGREICLDNKTLLNFCSNDYLGLANDPRIIAALKRGADQYGVGSGASHLVVGHSRVHQQLELALADFTQRERALVFTNGYSANMAVIRALAGEGDVVWQDCLNHASLLDGGWISRAEVRWFAHRDYHQLQQLLRDTELQSEQQHLIASDGVFSMDGDMADIASLTHIARTHNACLMIDDAHGFGVLGEQGRGSVSACEFNGEAVPVLVGTLGKAFGTAGAFVAGSDELIEWLIQSARNYIFSTAMPSAIAAATLCSLHIVQTEQWRRDHLNELIHYFSHCARQMQLPLLHSTTPIQPLLLNDSATCLRVSQALEQLGIYAAAIRPPTVPENSSRIRVTLSAAHCRSDIDKLIEALVKSIRA